MIRKQTVIPILGMHRSGTSLTTRALNLMGMEIGWPLQPAGPDNTKGFWEHLPFQTHNKELLACVGAPTSGWGTQQQLRRAAAEMATFTPAEFWWRPILAMLERQFRGPVWGMKDPRLVITWPFWRRFLQSNGWTDIRPVVVTRHPAAVLKSVLTRGDLDVMAAAAGTTSANLFLQCWTTYYSLLLASLGGGTPPVFLTQEDLLDPSTSPYDLERVCAAIGGDPQMIDAALAWVDPKMDHRSTSIRIPDEVESVYQRLRGMAHKQRESWMEKRSHRLVVPPPPRPALFVPDGVERPQSGLYAHLVGAVAPLHRRLSEESSQCVPGLTFLSLTGLVDATLPPDDGAVVNLDRVEPGAPGYSEEYVQVLRRFQVLEPRENQVPTLRRLGVRAMHLPISCPPPPLELQPRIERGIDVLMYGAMSERREAIARRLTRAGLNTLIVTNTVGRALSSLIRDAKVVLHVHHAPWHEVSATRLSLPAALGTMLIAERSLRQAADADNDSLAHLAYYDELVAHAQSAILSNDWYASGLAAQALHARSYPAIFERGVAALQQIVPTSPCD